MKARRTIISAYVAACLLGGGALGTVLHHDSDTQQVGTSSTVVGRSATSVGIEGCSSDCGLADEPSVLVYGNNPAYSPVACDMATDDLEDGTDQVTPELAKRCDYRVTGAACPEDGICAVQVIRDTGDFTGTR